MTLGERIRQIRGVITQEEFANTIGITKLQVSRIENDKSGISLDLAINISKAYNYSVDWISTGKEYRLPIVEEPLITYELQNKYIKVLEENQELRQKLNEQQEVEIKELQATSRV